MKVFQLESFAVYGIIKKLDLSVHRMCSVLNKAHIYDKHLLFVHYGLYCRQGFVTAHGHTQLYHSQPETIN